MSPLAETQLSFHGIAPEQPHEPIAEVDLVDAILASHDGDFRAAIADLLADSDFLRDQLHTASCLIGKGFVRGSWKPKYERM
jgi:hypothetical protein